MATHSSILAWRIPWVEEPGGLQSMGSQRVGHDWATSLSLWTHMLLGSISTTFEKNIRVFLPALGLHCRMRAFSSCGGWGPHCSGFSCCRAQALGTRASVFGAWGFS